MNNSPINPSTAPMGLFPTMSSLQEVLDFADSTLPIKNKNELCSLIFVYHNTLLKLLERTKEQEKTA